jgi:hypothetical protein
MSNKIFPDRTFTVNRCQTTVIIRCQSRPKTFLFYFLVKEVNKLAKETDIISGIIIGAGVLAVLLVWGENLFGLFQSETMQAAYMIFGVLMVLLGVLIKHLEIQRQIREVLALGAESK